MSKMTIKSLLIADYENEKANKFVFSDSANLIVSSTNGEGKSSLVKSIYYALGANLKSFPKGWNADNFIFQLEVFIDGNEFLIKRHNKVISVLDNNEVKLFENFAEYYLWFQEKLKMRLELVNKSSDKASLASVEALFSPMYIDQDKAWDGKLFKDSFESLGRYKSNDFPKNVFDYYLGISDSQIVDKESKKNEYLRQLELVNGRINQVQSVYKTYRTKNKITETVPKDFKDLQKELDFYITETDKFSIKITDKTGELSKEKIKLDILNQDLEELKKLSSKIKERFSEIRHECVYCHSILTRQQSLTRLELEDNELAIKSRIDSISQQIMKSKRIVQEKEEDIKHLQEQFNQYHERLTELRQLSDIDEYVNQNVLSELKKLEIQETLEKSNLDKLIGDITKEIRMLKKELNQRAKTIEGEYEALKNELSILIGSTGITDKKFRNFDKLEGSGTNLNKDLLVIFLVYMNLIDSKSITSLPFAIDSFVKNETDKKVLKKMFDAINAKFLSLKSQTFFSIIRDNLKYVDSKVNQVNIESPLLKSEYYSDLSKEII
ncbi:endonuclease [Streptococcus oralis]|uniref:endonuclease n=1 Tax=Streptococcus oralis TaxID=1303 RepID=UPI001C05849D|nr:endonuclease [Streptococcus oralis]MBU0454770.1 endonuclease [Streptococcus oralis]MBZ2093690.1 endonuclease [Streptococcus oralis]MBZ2098835.1 endonuclease [Streptococcus oralis]QXW61816.1 endonuclease [Streptococcus oralis]